MNLVLLWDCIVGEKRGKAYADLAQLYYQLCGEKLPEPKGLRGEPEREPNIFNAPDYEELEEIRVDKEVRKTKRHFKDGD